MTIGERLDKWLISQVIIFLLILLSTPFMPMRLPLEIKLIGGGLLIIGLVVMIIAFFQLGASFTPFVNPNEKGRLVTSGIYSVVRHPMYSGGLLFAFGWSVAWGTGLGFLLSIVLCFILDRKASEEEKLLTHKYHEYALYRMHVKKFIPFIY